MGILSKLFSCCNSSKLGRSVHFHAPAEDSVHVMIKHDMKRNSEHGVPQKGYSARKPLSEIMAAQQTQIQATEDDDQILSNIKNADGSNQATSQWKSGSKDSYLAYNTNETDLEIIEYRLQQ